MNVSTQAERELSAASFFPSSFSYKASWLFSAIGIFFWVGGTLYQLMWMNIFRGLYDAPDFGDLVPSVAEIMAAKSPVELVMYSGTYLLDSVGAGFICMGLLGYLTLAVERRIGRRKCAAAGLDAESVRAGIRFGKQPKSTVSENARFTDRTCAVSFMLSLSLLVSACLHQFLWDGIFDLFVETTVKLPAELVMHGGSLLLLGLSAGAFCVAIMGMFKLGMFRVTALPRRQERAHD